MDLESSLAAFILTFLGMMFLLGEFMVKLKGISGILGFGFILLFFSAHLSSFNLLIVVSIFVFAIILIIIDGKLLNDGTLSVIAIILMLLVVGLTTSNWVTGMYAVIGVILGTFASFLFLKIFPKRNMWDRMALMDRLTNEGGYSSLNKEYKELINKVGVALTDLRPVGTIRINGKDYSAISNGIWIKKNESIKVVQVDGTKILVEIVEN
ncbi:NfeD family protein [Salirhabdus sp. Marseille-P4669]|uniref:NfeD family protein n=1 Tax=Salirhabdus sp. Marseille-P4669 TaxID=2042310 RepID=UPI001F22FA83|nr:NfeD family protein [Salirhabdus sp. Marseille-P4669]